MRRLFGLNFVPGLDTLFTQSTSESVYIVPLDGGIFLTPLTFHEYTPQITCVQTVLIVFQTPPARPFQAGF